MAFVRVELTPPKKPGMMSKANPENYIQSEETISSLKRKTSLKLRGETTKRLRLEPPPLDKHKSMEEYIKYAHEIFPNRQKLSVEMPISDFLEESQVNNH